MIIIDLVFTQHSVKKIDGLGISRREVETAVKQGMRWKEKNRSVWHSLMAGVEVVFQLAGKQVVVITVYYSKRRK